MIKSVLDQLASSLGQRDEKPNIDLAIRIVKSGNTNQVKELFELLQSKKPAVRNDTIKVLYEIGERKPEFISKHVGDFVGILKHKDNRMRWGAMTALSSIGNTKPELLVPHLIKILEAMDEGSVITRDHGMYILAQIATLKKHHADAMELMLEQLEKAPVNQVPMYAEKTSEVVSAAYVKRLISVLKSRKDVAEIPSKAKRIEKLVKQLNSRT